MKRSFLLILIGLAASFVIRAQEAPDTLVIPPTAGTNVPELLLGRTAGVEVVSSPGAPGMVPTIHIRGVAVTPGLQPVYVVDGIRRRDLTGIDPGLIEKVEVLKDAAAMGLWGPEASRGVVAVTTKRTAREGFHAEYAFQGAVQNLTAVPRKMTLEDWSKPRGGYVFYPETSYLEPKTATPETSFLQHHLLSVRYGGKKLSAHAGFSVLDNDGPYPGRTDTERRYAASWSAEYRPFPWLTVETTGRWSSDAERIAPDGWLTSYLVSTPIRRDYYYPVKAQKNEKGLTETVLQGKVEVRPLPGLYLRGTGGVIQGVHHVFVSNWEEDTDRLSAGGEAVSVYVRSGDVNREWLQWGAEAGWSGSWRGHRLRLGMTFRQFKEHEEDHILAGYASGLPFGDDALLQERFLLPAYDVYLAAGGGLDGFNESNLREVPSAPVNRNWKEGIVQAGYDWKGRYHVGFSYYRTAGLSLHSDAWNVPAVTAEWTLTEEPWLRRALPSWWTGWSVKASWAKTGPYLPILDYDNWTLSQFRFNYSKYFMDSRHQDLKTDLSFRWGRADLDLSAAWYLHDDRLLAVLTPEYEIRNRGLELSGDFRGHAGAFRYAASANLTFYRNRVTFKDRLAGILSLGWGRNSPLALADGEPVGGDYLAVWTEKDRYTTFLDGRHYVGSAFPATSGGVRVSVGWKRWQLTPVFVNEAPDFHSGGKMRS